MVESSKNKVISILTNPNQLNKNDLKIIKNISQTYPYFTPVKILQLILSKKFKTIDYNKILKSTSILTTDRSHLYYIINNDILNDNEKEAVMLVEKYKRDFKNNFVIEIQNTGKESHKIFMASILPIASRLNIPVIATNDVLFGDREDFEIHETKVCINSGKTLNDPNREKIYSEEQYFKSQDEMQELFKDFPEVLSNTLEIAKQCNLSLEPDGYFLPEYPVLEG